MGYAGFRGKFGAPPAIAAMEPLLNPGFGVASWRVSGSRLAAWVEGWD